MESKKELGLVGSLDNCWDSLYLKHKLFFNEIPAEFKTKCFVNCKLIFNKTSIVLFDIEKLQIMIINTSFCGYLHHHIKTC